MIRKLGTFFLLMGVLLLIVFFAAPTKNVFYFRFFFAGLVLLALGFVAYQLTKEEKSPSVRFSLLRKLLQKNEK